MGFLRLEVVGRAVKCKEHCMAEILEREERLLCLGVKGVEEMEWDTFVFSCVYKRRKSVTNNKIKQGKVVFAARGLFVYIRGLCKGNTWTEAELRRGLGS